VTTFIQGVSFSVVCFSTLLTNAAWQESIAGIMGIASALVLAAVALALYRCNFNMLVYQLGFLAQAVGLLLVGLFPQWPVLGVAVSVAAFFYLDIVLWALGSYLVKNRFQPVGWVVLLPTFALVMGLAAGGAAILGLNGTALEQIAWQGSTFEFWILSAFVVLMAALLMSNNANLKHGWGLINATASDDFEERAEACRLIAQEAGLTKREFEVLLLMAKGMNRNDIAREQHLSPNTIKTHMLNVYRKLNVHSHKELTRHIDTAEKSLGAPSTNSRIQLTNTE
jgi:DNA-binding CsgD family transcriptional regulator